MISRGVYVTYIVSSGIFLSHKHQNWDLKLASADTFFASNSNGFSNLTLKKEPIGATDYEWTLHGLSVF